MNELEVPDAAIAALDRAQADGGTAAAADITRALENVRAIADPVAATELRRLLHEHLRTGASLVYMLRDRANELDPEGKQ